MSTTVHKICSGNNWLTWVGDKDRNTGMEAGTLAPWTCQNMENWGPRGNGLGLYHFDLYR